jgi:multiple antibiotic resistance protein
MGIPLAAFELAGGIVLFLFALTMIFGESKPEQEKSLPRDAMDIAIYPLALPSLASPGAILAVVMLTENHQFSWIHQLSTWCVMVLVLSFAWLLMKLATPLTGLLGNGGASVLSRVMGLIIAAIAVHAALEGVSHYFDLTTIERAP